MVQPDQPARLRIASIDIVRGAVMLIMALDHVRDFFHNGGDPTDLSGTTPALFFTRWITHFCAPVFVFLSGLSAFISGQRKTRKQLGLFLVKRGLWLVVVEIVVITFGITFNPYYNFILLQVIWAIGWSMVILGLLLQASYMLVLITGALLFFGHNILDHVSLPATGTAAVAWKLLITSPVFFIPLAKEHLVIVAYAILPWTAIMLLGYAFGHFYTSRFETRQRRRILLLIGGGFTLLFLLLRAGNIYGDPAPWSEQQTPVFSLLSFLNVTKYPASLQYSCMTLGPAIMLLALLESTKGRLASVISIYGRVPFFYYVLHFYLIHLLCMAAFFASGYTKDEIGGPGTFAWFRPDGFDLPVVYLVWLVVILLLYYPCRWFARYKQVHRQWWLSYC